MANFSYTSSLGILQRAGAQVDSSVSNAMLLRFSDDAEAIMNGVIRSNLNTTYANLDAGLKEIVRDAADSYGAMLAINYNLQVYNSLAEVQTKLNLLRDNVERGIAVIKESKWKEVIGIDTG